MKRNDESFIERRIIIGLVVSSDYLTQVRKIWSSRFIEEPTLRRVSNWCWEFYEKYQKAPGRDIEPIFVAQTKKDKQAVRDDLEDLLVDLMDEFDREDKFNVSYLLDQTVEYFDNQRIRLFIEDLEDDLTEGNLNDAKSSILSFSDGGHIDDRTLDLSRPEALDSIEKAFKEASQPLFLYPRQIGQFLNDQLLRSGFISLLAPEKRGKTFFLLDMAMRAARQGVNVAFFQAGDMTEAQQLKRMCVHLAKKSDKEKYSGMMYEPVRDCIHNQMDTCDLEQRECDFGVFEDKTEREIREDITRKELIEALNDDENEGYKPCYNCTKYWNRHWGAVWLKKVNSGRPLDANGAKKVIEKFFIENKRRFKLSTHPNKTLKVSDIESELNLWEREDGFVSDLIIIDYADILASDLQGDFRQQENDKWMRLRALSQKKHALVVTATQADANSYTKGLLNMTNFSEDKRKFAHVTAMYGLNQDPRGREKEIGIMRINEILVREGDYSPNSVVHVLQNLSRGQACLSSYW